MVELLDIYDDAGHRIGLATRRECHGNPALLHRTAHVVVINCAGDRLLLQKRSAAKDIQPGKWDTAVGGHLDAGEDYETAARRELAEELGITDPGELIHLFDTRIRNDIESEDVRVFLARLDGPFVFVPEEIDEVRFFSPGELACPDNLADFTPCLIAEIARLREAGVIPLAD